MKTIILMGLGILLLVFSSFKIDNSEFLGMWAVNVKAGFYFEKVKTPPKERSYFIFKENGILEYKQQNKACGDVADENLITAGTWKQATDSTLALTYNSCVGKVYVQWILNKESKIKLKYRVLAYAGDRGE